LLVTQICFAQLEFFNYEQKQKIESEQLTDAVNVNLDSLMLDSIITAYMNSENIPGAATLIIKNNELIWNKNYGYRNLELQLPVEDSTMFLMASISKTIMATAVMQIWENGLIDLEGDINNYLPSGFIVKNPNFPNDTITVKMVMTHTSSLQDNWNILDAVTVCGDSPIRLDTFLVNYFEPGGIYYNINNFYNYHPGLRFNYCNAASCLLALIVENLSGKSFDEYCRDSIFTPLSMNSTSWFLTGMDTAKIATPYLIHNPPIPICHQGFPDYVDGQLRTNKLELSNFLSAYMNGGTFNNNRILDSSTISMMLSDQCGLVHMYGGKQGLIWYSHPTIFETVWGHSGGTYGANTDLFFNPQEKWGFAFFINWASPPNWSTGFRPTAIQIANYAHLYGNIYALKSSVDKSYSIIGQDSVLFQTKFSNIYNHQFTPHLIYVNTDSTQIDSLTLFDDGLHGDFFSNDGIYGGYIPPQQNENFYNIGVSTIDNQTNKYYNTPDRCRFTTAGPVILDSVSVRKQFTLYAVRPFVHNSGSKATIKNASLKLLCDDPWLKSSVQSVAPLPDLAPDSSVGISTWISISYIDSLFPGYFNFKAEILSDNFTYWTDSIRVNVITGVEDEIVMPSAFKLEQNYPNPFNPTTKITFAIPLLGGDERGGLVTLKVYDVLGNEVTTLVNENKPAGSYEVEFDASKLSSGVYFYQLKAGGFLETKKMLLLR
jgi:CubicO group peptidase (beta-lactamase class C family)